MQRYIGIIQRYSAAGGRIGSVSGVSAGRLRARFAVNI